MPHWLCFMTCTTDFGMRCKHNKVHKISQTISIYSQFILVYNKISVLDSGYLSQNKKFIASVILGYQTFIKNFCNIRGWLRARSNFCNFVKDFTYLILSYSERIKHNHYSRTASLKFYDNRCSAYLYICISE